MSTILQAQQKNKREQAGGPAPITQQNNNIQLWKVMLSLALATIITLLSILIYLQLNPRLEVVPVAVMPTVEDPSSESQQQVQQQTEQNNSLVKVSFETQPLAIMPAEPKKVVATPKVTAEPQVSAPKTAMTESAEEQQRVVSHTNENQPKATSTTNEIKQQEVEYTQASEALKKRFDLAVLMSEIEDNEQQNTDLNEDEQLGDGSDIHKMSSSFQDKVPLIHYDSHMYSSIVEERWIRINGEVLKEGDVDSTGELELLEIQPQRSIFRLDRQSFSLESLVDWRGY